MEEETMETQPNQQVLEQMPVAMEEKKPNIELLIVMSLIVISLIAGGVYAGMQLGKKQILPNEIISESQTPTQVAATVQPEPTTISTPTETANWKTYYDNNFSFKYPSEWYIFGYEETPGTLNWGFSTKPVATNVRPIENLAGIVVFLTQTPLEKFQSDLVSAGEKNEGQLVINNKNAIRFSYKGIDGSNNIRVAIDLNGKTLVLNGSVQGSEKLIFDQILSTFKFLD